MSSAGSWQIDERYEILGYNRRGALGDVWTARESITGRHFSMEFLDTSRTKDLVTLLRFHRRFRLIRWPTFQHPAANPIFRLALGRTPYVLMKCVDGESVAELLAGGSARPEDALAIAGSIAHLLRHAHAAGIAHGSLTPESVFVNIQGEVQAADVGLVAAWEGWDGASFTDVAARRSQLRTRDIAALEELLRGLLGKSSRSPTEPSWEERPLSAAPSPLSPEVPPLIASAWTRLLEERFSERSGQFFLDALAQMRGSSVHLRPAAARRGPDGAGRISDESASDGTRVVRRAALSRPSVPASRRPTVVRVSERLSRIGSSVPAGRPLSRASHQWGPVGLRRLTSLGLVAILLALVAVSIGMIFQTTERTSREGGARRPSASASGVTPRSTSRVPTVVGVPVLEARDRLIESGLRLGPLRPMLGPPGEVVAAIPQEGSIVTPGISVTLIVGVTASRLESLPSAPSAAQEPAIPG